MAASDPRLSNVLDIPGEDAALGRTLLSERAAETLRNYISSGRVPEGTKITEREVSTLLGVSRVPAREALKILEGEGLVVVRSGGRYVTTLTEKDVCDLYVLRCNLETLAIRLAAQTASEEDLLAMSARMEDMEEAAAGGDPNECARCDMALHRSIWQASGNAYLLKILDSVLGSIFVLADRDRAHSSDGATRGVKSHRKLIDLVAARKAEEASEEMERQLMRALKNSLKTFQLSEQPPDSKK